MHTAETPLYITEQQEAVFTYFSMKDQTTKCVRLHSSADTVFLETYCILLHAHPHTGAGRE